MPLCNSQQVISKNAVVPSLQSDGQYRLRAQTGLAVPLKERLSWKVMLEQEYNSCPKGTAKKTDYLWLSALAYES